MLGIQNFTIETDSREHLATVLGVVLPIMFPRPANPNYPGAIAVTRRDLGFDDGRYDTAAAEPTRLHVCSITTYANDIKKEDFSFNYHYESAVDMVKALLGPLTLSDMRDLYNCHANGDGHTEIGYRLSQQNSGVLDVSLCFIYYGK